MSVILEPAWTPPVTTAINANNPLVGWQSFVTGGSIEAETADPDYPASNMANPDTFPPWKAGDATDQFLYVTVGGETVDYVAFARHNLDLAGVPVTVAVSAAGSPEVFEDVSAEFTPTHGGAHIVRFEPRPNVNRVRIRLNVADAPAQIAVLYVGALLVMQRRLYVEHIPITMAADPEVVHHNSESGEFLGRIQTGGGRSNDANFQNLTPAWVRSSLAPFLASAITRPFFWAWRPGTYPDETAYAWFRNNPKPVNQRPNGMMRVEMQIGAIA
jgi:hypothetical protein